MHPAYGTLKKWSVGYVRAKCAGAGGWAHSNNKGDPGKLNGALMVSETIVLMLCWGLLAWGISLHEIEMTNYDLLELSTWKNKARNE